MLYKETLLQAVEFERESSYITYTVDLPKGMLFISPLYNPKHTVRLEDTGFRYSPGGKQQLRFSYSSGVGYSGQEFPKKGEPLAVAVEVLDPPKIKEPKKKKKKTTKE
jgi:hypothetical protein